MAPKVDAEPELRRAFLRNIAELARFPDETIPIHVELIPYFAIKLASMN